MNYDNSYVNNCALSSRMTFISHLPVKTANVMGDNETANLPRRRRSDCPFPFTSRPAKPEEKHKTDARTFLRLRLILITSGSPLVVLPIPHPPPRLPLLHPEHVFTVQPHYSLWRTIKKSIIRPPALVLMSPSCICFTKLSSICRFDYHLNCQTNHRRIEAISIVLHYATEAGKGIFKISADKSN